MCERSRQVGAQLEFLMVLACYKQIVLRVSLPTCAWERGSQPIVSPVRCPGVLLGELELSPASLTTRRILTELLLCIMEN